MKLVFFLFRSLTFLTALAALIVALGVYTGHLK